MNVKQLHLNDKLISTYPLLQACSEGVKSIRMVSGSHLKRHTSKIPAVLVCLQGKVVFSGEDGLKETMLPGDYVLIRPAIYHWLDAQEETNLLLIR